MSRTSFHLRDKTILFNIEEENTGDTVSNSLINDSLDESDCGFVTQFISEAGVVCGDSDDSPGSTDFVESKPEVNSNPDNFEKDQDTSLNIDHVLRLVPEFDGSVDLLRKFINVCEIFYTPLTKEDDKKIFLQIVQSKLSGRAYELILYKKIETWKDLKKELTLQFEDSRTVEQLQIELIKLIQGQNENVRTFALNIEKTLSALNSACIRREGKKSAEVIYSLNEATALRSFQDGLHRSISIIVKACRFETLKEAVDKAIEEEMSFMNKPRFQSTSIKCQFCSKPGHAAKEYFQLNKPSSSYTGNSPNLRNHLSNNGKAVTNFKTNMNSVKCLYCKNIGHMLKDCRKRMYNNQRKENTNQSTTQNIHVAENSHELVQKNQDTVVRVQDL